MAKIPQDWLPAAQMKRIHLHWTAGTHRASALERSHYHILIEGDGTLVRGNTSIAANAAGSGLKPASHTKNANTGAIGVSLCCMLGAKEAPFVAGNAPMTQVQWDAAIDVIAQLARSYNIPVTPETILTHAEVEPNLHIKQTGKWDITRLAFDETLRGYAPVGAKLRREVAAMLDTLAGAVTTPPVDSNLQLPKYKVTGVAPSTLSFRRTPAGDKAGALPEGAVVERMAIIGGWWQVRSKAGFVGWVWSSYLTPT